jgi:hypothetical protein
VADDVMTRSATDARSPTPGAVPATTISRPESRADRARRLAYRGRFTVLYFLLAVVAGAAVGTLVVLLERGSPAPAPPWSEWQPEGSAERRAGQIGDRIPDPYRLPSGRQLATVTYVGPPTVTGPDGTTFQVRALAVRPNTSGGQAEADDIDTVNASGTLMYNLCGLGNSCSIPEGKASNARGALLRREALELALYTFKYLDGVQSVLVMLPPRPDGQASTAVFLERGDVRALLAKPLDRTFTAPIVPGIGEIGAEELAVVERVTRPRLYSFSYLQAQDGSPIMVLAPVLSG